jgi:hypothetical protein
MFTSRFPVWSGTGIFQSGAAKEIKDFQGLFSYIEAALEAASLIPIEGVNEVLPGKKSPVLF